MKRVVVFTGAGVSADSGIATFRDSDGLWANYRVEDICTPEALIFNRAQVIDFYNARRKELLASRPNAGHYAIARLEEYFDVDVVTQNIDDLHERAGSTRITHLHGELRKLCSSKNTDLVYPIEGWEQKPDAKAEDGSLLRPFVVFFGEPVPNFEKATAIVSAADILVVIGSSLAVYPAASLVRYASAGVPIYLVDPVMPQGGVRNLKKFVQKRSAEGTPLLVDELIREYA